MSDVSAWAQVWKINQTSLRATCCAGLAWLCWQGYLAGVDWLSLFAAMFAVGTVQYGAIALFQTVKAIAGTMHWQRFKRQGATPKADPLAGRDVLRDRGLL